MQKLPNSWNSVQMTFSLLILEQMKLIWAFTCFNPSVWSISKFDERCCFLYVHDNSDDFQIYFSTEEQCGRWGHTSRCVCVGVCVCLRLCSYSTCVRLYWNMTGWPRCVNNTVIMCVVVCVCVFQVLLHGERDDIWWDGERCGAGGGGRRRYTGGQLKSLQEISTVPAPGDDE